MRGLKLLRVGGRLVYSTCSLNPIEDEAVVMALIRRCKGSVRIVDVSSMYPNLKRANGLFQWKVCDQENGVYPDFASIPEDKKRLYRESMFAPVNENEAREIHLERAMRFLPHFQDTGGFFVCVLEKISPIPRADKEEEEAKEETKLEEEEVTEPKNMEEEVTTEKNEVNEEEEEIDGGDLVGIVKEEQR